MVYQCFSTSCAFPRSSGQRACSSECTISAFSDINDHQIGNMVPRTVLFAGVRSVPLYFSSWSEKFFNVCGEIFWRTQRHLKNPTCKFLCFSAFLQSMSLYTDMEIILSSNLSCRIVLYAIVLWISRSNCSIVCLGKILHPITAGSPSIRSNSRYSEECVNHYILPLQDPVDRGYSANFLRQSTESEKTYTFAVDSSTALSFNKAQLNF